MSSWPLPKDPDDVCKYRFNWGAERLADGETILTSSFTVDRGTVVVSAPTIVGGLTQFTATGGTNGEVCVISNRVTTSDGNQYDWSSKLRIRSTS